MDMRSVNRFVSTVIPVILLGMVGYATYVFIGTLCIDYFVIEKKQRSRGAGLLAGYVIFFTLFMLPYIRTVLTINLNPGYTESNTKPGDEPPKSRKPSKKWHMASKSAAYEAQLKAAKNSPSESPTTNDSGSRMASGGEMSEPPPVPTGPVRPTDKSAPVARASLREFANKDVYICEADGLPRWCSHCNNWKPDRTHHSAEVGRCVRRMDHVCPWVGGVVGETSMKFFVQTVFYGGLYTVYMLVVMAIYVKQKASEGSVNNQWIAVLILSAAFGLFSVGMSASTIQLLLRNRTTLENIYAKSRIYFIAIQDDTVSGTPKPESTENKFWRPVTEISYPLPETHALHEQTTSNGGTPLPPRKFRVVKTDQGVNPWHLDEAFDNIAEVMGYRIWEWFLPITRSPVEHTHASRFNERFIQKLKAGDYGRPAPSVPA